MTADRRTSSERRLKPDRRVLPEEGSARHARLFDRALVDIQMHGSVSAATWDLMDQRERAFFGPYAPTDGVA